MSKFLRLSLQSLALGLGAYLAVGNKISAGAVFAASFLAGRALQPIEQLLSTWRSVAQARSAYTKLNDLLGAREAEIALTQLPPPEGRLDVEQISVANAAGDGAILANISFQLVPGEVIAVVGPSGAGKSTLLRMLAGAGRPDRGIIRVDRANVMDWDPEKLAAYIGFLPQDVSLFAGTVKENIARFEDGSGDDDADIDARAIHAAKACFAHELILGLPNGYDSMLGWGGRGLSAGQAQRIGLARALYGDPPIILLDEPNAHLDAAGEGQLVETLVALKARKAAVLVVAHRMGVLAAVDKILVLRDGRIEAFGTRDEIISRLSGAAAAPIEAPQTPGKRSERVMIARLGASYRGLVPYDGETDQPAPPIDDSRSDIRFRRDRRRHCFSSCSSAGPLSRRWTPRPMPTANWSFPGNASRFSIATAAWSRRSTWSKGSASIKETCWSNWPVPKFAPRNARWPPRWSITRHSAHGSRPSSRAVR